MKHSADKKPPLKSAATPNDNLTINAGAAKPIKAKIKPAAELKPRATKVVNTNEAPEAHDGFAQQFQTQEPGSKRSVGFRGIAIGVIALLLVGALALSMLGGGSTEVAEAPAVVEPAPIEIAAPVVAPEPAPAPVEVVAEVVAPAPVVEPAPVEVAEVPVDVETPVEASAPVDTNDLIAQMTSGLMSALAAPSEAEVAAVEATGLADGVQHSDLYNLVTTALVQGQSETYIDLLINDAAASGRIDVPDALRTADGKVNTAAILAVVALR